MNTDKAIDIVGVLGVLAIVIVGFIIILYGLIGNWFRGYKAESSFGFQKGVFGRTVLCLLAFAVIFKFFFEGYAKGLYNYQEMLLLSGFFLISITLVPGVETLVGIAALTVFLVDNTATFGPVTLNSFIALLIFLSIASFIRWALGR